MNSTLDSGSATCPGWRVALVAFMFYAVYLSPTQGWTFFFQLTVNGIILGSVYALIALGYTMVYGILKLLNFAHGDVYMIGAFIGFGVLTLLGGPLNPAIPVALLVAVHVRRRDARVGAARRGHRALRLPAAARRAANRPADLRARRRVLPRELGAAAVRLAVPQLRRFRPDQLQRHPPRRRHRCLRPVPRPDRDRRGGSADAGAARARPLDAAREGDARGLVRPRGAPR